MFRPARGRRPTGCRRRPTAPPEFESGWSCPRLQLLRKRSADRGPFSGQRYDRTGRALLHAVHDPLIHAKHQLVEVLLRRDRALVGGLRLNLLEHAVELLLHLRRRILSALDQLLRFAAQLLHLLEQCDRFTILMHRLARALERLVLRALPYQPTQFLSFLFQHLPSLFSVTRYPPPPSPFPLP